MKKSLVLLAILTSFSLVACDPNQGGGGGGGNNNDSRQEITVKFYGDYNQKVIENVYYTCKVYKGDKITDIPADPTEPFYPEFPVFKGWSVKELIGSEEDLWNFATDIVDTDDNTMYLFGYWAAEGE